MAFKGRPSKACFACRGRRIKCDRIEVGCGQCSRMNIPCPGYPDPLEQGYRDQSELVMKKAEASYTRKARRGLKAKLCPSSPSNVATSTVSEHSWADLMMGTLCRDPSLHLDTIAVTEFMASYVPQSPFDYLPVIYTDSQPGSSLNVNVQAVSLAMTASKLKDPRMLRLARQLYTTALSDTNTALRTPEKAIQDSTFISVLLLGLFEALACQVTGASSNWAAHTRGALALLRLRGKAQFRRPLGCRLFDQMCGILTFETVLRKTSLPLDLLELVSIAKLVHGESPRTLFTNLIGEITESPSVLWDCDMLPSVKVTKALWLDHRVLQFTKGLPSDYDYQEMHKEMKDTPNSGWEIHGHIIHQHQHHHSARLWNACRVLRIMLNGVIHRTLSQLPSSVILTQRRAIENIKDAATDICASVPQFLSPEKYDKIGIEASDEARVATLIAALSVTKAEPLAPSTARSYAGERLKYMGKRFKIPQAESAASGMGLNVLHSGFHMLYVY